LRLTAGLSQRLGFLPGLSVDSAQGRDGSESGFAVLGRDEQAGIGVGRHYPRRKGWPGNDRASGKGQHFLTGLQIPEADPIPLGSD
jgi:hypothetical protein